LRAGPPEVHTWNFYEPINRSKILVIIVLYLPDVQ
jgi:hypothetical protein